MKLIIFNSEIDAKILVKKENKLYWKTDKFIYLVVDNNIPKTISNLTKILFIHKITEIIYLGFSTSISKKFCINDIIIIEKAYNVFVNLTKFGYEIGKFPGEKTSNKLDNKIITLFLKKIDLLKKGNVGSSCFGVNNKNYLEYINENFPEKIDVIDNLTGAIFFTAKKFGIENIICFLIINKSKYNKVIIENRLISNFYKSLLKII